MMDTYQVISTLGFPIFVCLYFMFRTEKIIMTLTDVVKANSEICERIYERLK